MNTPQEFCNLISVKLNAKTRGAVFPAMFNQYHGYTIIVFDYNKKTAHVHGYVDCYEDTGSPGSWKIAERSLDLGDPDKTYYLWREWSAAYGKTAPVIKWDIDA